MPKPSAPIQAQGFSLWVRGFSHCVTSVSRQGAQLHKSTVPQTQLQDQQAVTGSRDYGTSSPTYL